MQHHQDPQLRPGVCRRVGTAARGLRALALAGALAVGPVMAPAPAAAEPPSSFVNYENHPIHAVDMSPNGQLLAVTNLPDARVEFFDLTSGNPVLDGARSVQVGIDPVSVRFRTDGELWVVNQISDSISVVDVATRRVVATIPTLDEPFDVVFAGTPRKAFVSCSQVNTVQVFDVTTRQEVAQVPINGEDPRALAVSPDGSKVYAAIFESGNGTTLLGGGITPVIMSNLGRIGYPPNVVNEVSGPYGGVNPPPNVGGPTGGFFPPINPALPPPPKVSLIVRKGEDNKWLDDNGGDWTDFVSGANAAKSGRKPGWDLPDRDLAIINAETYAVSYVTRLMNICMAIAVNPASGHVFMIGTDAGNQIRFEPNVNGKFVKAMIAEIDPATNTRVKLTDLNPHLNYQTPQTTREERGKSLGDPRAIAWDSAGNYAYVVGMGSNNLMAYDANSNRSLALPVNVGEGPVGIQLDETHGLIYIFNRFASTLTVLNMWTRALVTTIPLHDSSPPAIKVGRKHLYDTHKNSGLGQLACGSCHIDGKMDRLAWDLGSPAGTVKPLNFVLANGGDGSQPHAHNLIGEGLQNTNLGLNGVPFKDFDPMKGPMTTQTLVDIIGHEPLHWRGDKDGLEEFNGAFMSLQGAERGLSPQEMQEFENMVATLTFPPNPFRKFNNSLPTDLPLPNHFVPEVIDPATLQPKPEFPEGDPMPHGSAVRGMDLYRSGGVPAPGFPNFFRNIDGGSLACVTCHTLPVGSGPDLAVRDTPDLEFVPLLTGPLGEHHLGLVSVDGSTNATMKIPQLRNMYEKIGFDATQLDNNAGFGFLHDGGVDSLERFITEPVFDVRSVQELADLVAFVMSFSGSELPQGTTNLASLDPPGTPGQDSHAGAGRQFTISSSSGIPLIDGQNALSAMLVEANDPEVDALVSGETVRRRGLDLIVKGEIGGVARGWVWDSARQLFQSDRQSETISQSALLALAAPGQELTFTAVPRGSGIRLGVDRDLDGYYDLTEAESGTDPGNPGSVPSLPVITMNPQSQTVRTGSTVIFTVGAVAGGTISYQWLKNDAEMSGKTGASLRIDGADPVTDSGGYKCRVSTAAGPVTSTQAFLIVITDSVNGAAFVSASPELLLPGQVFTMGVRMSNTSSLSWGLPQGYALVVNSDPSNVLGGATQFPIRSNDDVVAANGGKYTFTGQATAPSGPFSVEFQMAQNGVKFGPTVNLAFMVGDATEVNLAINPVGWFGGVVAGSGAVASGSSGLCMTAPLAGDNIMGWVSPERYAPLVDLAAYRVLVTASTTQTADLSIPLWDITYDNYNSDGTGNVYGGETLFIDTAGGAAGIGRPQGLTTFHAWAIPNAAETLQWRGLLPGGGNENSAFTPTADASNDMRLIIRTLDLDSAGINAQIDSGTICVSRVRIESKLLSNLESSATVAWNPPIDGSTHAPQTLAQAGENAGVAVIDGAAHTALYQLGDGTVPGSRKTLIPFDSTQSNLNNALYPVQWNASRLYKGTMLVRSNVSGPEGGDPVDTVFVNADTATSELISINVSLRGSPGNMRFAASPRLASTTGGAAQPYIGFLYGHNSTVMDLTALPGANRLRVMGDFFNTAAIAPEGSGADPFAVTGLQIEEIVLAEP